MCLCKFSCVVMFLRFGFCDLVHCLLCSGMGIPAGIKSGTGMEKKYPPLMFAGMGTEKICPHGDKDGAPFPDGEFPIAIFSGCYRHHVATDGILSRRAEVARASLSL